MMNEQVFLGGRPVVGFGGDAFDPKFVAVGVGIPILGIVAGAGGGGAIGYKYGSGWGAAGGALVGGLAGGAAGILVAQRVAYAAAKNNETGVGAAPIASSLPWGEIIASSVVSALAGLAIEEAVHSVRKKQRR